MSSRLNRWHASCLRTTCLRLVIYVSCLPRYGTNCAPCVAASRFKVMPARNAELFSTTNTKYFLLLRRPTRALHRHQDFINLRDADHLATRSLHSSRLVSSDGSRQSRHSQYCLQSAFTAISASKTSRTEAAPRGSEETPRHPEQPLRWGT